MGYDYLTIEKKWQQRWENASIFKTDVYDFSKPKYYVLDMFPYPSAQGLHVGHPRGYTATDVVARMKRMQGFNVLHPRGWDAFGLPAEQYALKTNQHPRGFTEKNILNFTRQIKSLGLSYDWSKELSTTDPEYYKWTQWIFLKLFEAGLAYIEEKPVNFCPSLGTVLSNEEVINGKSEVGGFPVERRLMKQWILKITAYAEKLLSGLDGLNWPTSTMQMQKNWIGKSSGSEITFKVEGKNLKFNVFTTRADTLFGCTYCCLAPEHPLVGKITDPAHKKEVDEYISSVSSKSDIERTELNKEKTGVFTGAYAINPINKVRIPIWIADYVLASYGDGAVMAVPAHDQRDYEFASKYNLSIIQVIEGDVSKEAYVGDGAHINSGFINGLNNEEGTIAIVQNLIKLKSGNFKDHFKIRDWLFSRQRYWGEPIPVVIMDDDGKIIPLKINDLPLMLPPLDEFKPTGTGASPLALAKDWIKVKIDSKSATRETNTMPQWAGSCWYYLRYLDSKNNSELADPKLLAHWLPVDLYVGGAEHAVLHLLYARFWHKFLFDIKVVTTPEPFKRLFHQGMILGENGEKMSKSRGNVINPDDIVQAYGADTLRLYEMFVGPLEASLPWSNNGLDGSKRFIDRVWRLFTELELNSKFVNDDDGELAYSYNFMVRKVTSDIDALQMNTAVSQMMIFINDVYKAKRIPLVYMKNFLKIFNAFCPHVSEELWSLLGHKEMMVYEPWPKFDESKIVTSEVEMAVQVNGKLRSLIVVPFNSDDELVTKKALENPIIIKNLEGKTIKKIIVVTNKIVNIVAI